MPSIDREYIYEKLARDYPYDWTIINLTYAYNTGIYPIEAWTRRAVQIDAGPLIYLPFYYRPTDYIYTIEVKYDARWNKSHT